jgi:hypothetical protein
MSQQFYADKVLPAHIAKIKELEKKYRHKMLFQEDNDPSHGTRSRNNVSRQAKLDAQVQLHWHPAQSPDLNPIEGIWNTIKGRLRGRSWKTAEEFRAAIEAEWRRITPKQIRKCISEMPAGCSTMVATNGARYRSKLW